MTIAWVGQIPPLAIILGSVAVSTSAHVFLKLGAVRVSSGLEGWLNGWLLAGAAAHGLALVLWILALSRAPLSYAYPFIAIGFVATNLVAAHLLGESVTFERWVGVMLICAGVIVVARTA